MTDKETHTATDNSPAYRYTDTQIHRVTDKLIHTSQDTYSYTELLCIYIYIYIPRPCWTSYTGAACVHLLEHTIIR